MKGTYEELEVINSKSFTDLAEKTMASIIATCTWRHINRMHIRFSLN